MLVSCIEETFAILTREAFTSNLARFRPPIRIVKPTANELEALVRAVVESYHRRHGTSRHPTSGGDSHKFRGRAIVSPPDGEEDHR